VLISLSETLIAFAPFLRFAPLHDDRFTPPALSTTGVALGEQVGQPVLPWCASLHRQFAADYASSAQLTRG
jgi:hypothetical protein